LKGEEATQQHGIQQHGILHSTLKVGKDCHHTMSVEAHVKIICYEGTTKQILKGNHYLVYNQDW
jgi:hypothetical protein